MKSTCVPVLSDFPEETEFFILEWDVPLAKIPSGDVVQWVNWFGGVPRLFDVKWLKIDNNWPAESFEEWTELIASSIKN